jgi:hypothetical protein
MLVTFRKEEEFEGEDSSIGGIYDYGLEVKVEDELDGKGVSWSNAATQGSEGEDMAG